MGLDMYLGVYKPYGSENPGIMPIGYWRKANAIHRWFVKNIQDDKDNGDTYRVSPQQLLELKKLCIDVLDGKVAPEEVLPTQPGFFFGSLEYDDYYRQTLEDTLTIINNAILCGAKEFFYQASW